MLFDEAHARVDEEGDAPEDLLHAPLHLGLGRLARGAVLGGDVRGDPLLHGVEHRDRVAHRVSDLL